jgi:hypothetical protein
MLGKQRSSPYLDARIKGLAGWDYDVTSAPTHLYNCIAWAVGDDKRWWEPCEDYYWPEGAPFEYTVDALVKAYELIGYEICEDDSYDSIYEKVAIYVGRNGEKHAARQVDGLYWSSKLGCCHDIQHPLRALEEEYGPARVFMRRSRRITRE